MELWMDETKQQLQIVRLETKSYEYFSRQYLGWALTLVPIGIELRQKKIAVDNRVVFQRHLP
jgi:hypothetical protein